MGADNFQRALDSKNSIVRRHGFVDTVRQEQHRVAALQLDPGAGRVVSIGLQPQRDAAALQLSFDFAFAVEDESRRMACVRAREHPRLWIQTHEQHRDEPFIADVFGQHPVGAGQDFADVFAIQREEAQIGARLGHQQRRTDAVPGHVGDHDPQPAMEHRQVIKVIASGGVRGV